MKKTPETAPIESLNLDFKDDNTIWLSNGKTLRKIIGVLGMALPLLLYLFLYFDVGMTSPLESLSHYFYTRVSCIFVGVLTVLGIFLIIYKGKERVDFFVSIAAGIFILCVVCFPTDNLSGKYLPYSVTTLNDTRFRIGFHYASAGIFLCCLTYMSLFLFTKSDKAPARQGSMKKIRNWIYRICGILMIIAILVIAAGGLKIIPKGFYDDNCLTFWMETLAVESFGFSWLVKGEAMFEDK